MDVANDPAVKVGTILRNNDPRKAGEEVKVIAVLFRETAWFAVYQGKGRKNGIRLDRIYNDGVVRNNGWSVVPATDL